MKSFRVLGWTVAPILASCGMALAPKTESKVADSTTLDRTRLQQESHLVFRSILASNMKASCHAGFCSEKEIQHAILVPPKSLLAEPSQSGEPLQELRKRFAAHVPSELHAESLATPLGTKPNLSANIAARGPVTIVIVPGIWGEFIEKLVYQEAFDARGRFWDKWHGALGLVKDKAYDLHKLAEAEHSLEELAPIASIDGPDGKPQVQLILLRALRGSLETLGRIEDNANVYVRRLDKIFQQIPAADTPDIYFFGYSRGLPVALETIKKGLANTSGSPWAARVRGVAGLGGSFYGTEAAEDVIYNQNSSQHKLVQILVDLAKDLQLESTNPEEQRAGLAKFWEELKKMRENGINKPIENTKVWARAINKIVAATSANQEKKTYPGLDYELGLNNVKEVKPDIQGIGGLVRAIAFDVLALQRPVSQYYDNVKAFKQFLQASYQGVESLTQTMRKKWWEENIVPPHLKLFSLTATMSDITDPAKGLSPLFSLPGNGSTTLDFKVLLRPGYYQLAELTGNQLNDSQVTIYTSRYWNNMTLKYNTKQPQLEHYFLGTLGTSHWGFAFPYAFYNTSNRDLILANPYPRKDLIQAVGEFMALTR